MRNRNVLLTEDDAVIGIKTGAIPKAGACLVAARRFGGSIVVAVVLGSSGRYDEQRRFVDDGRWDDMHAIFAALAGDGR